MDSRGLLHKLTEALSLQASPFLHCLLMILSQLIPELLLAAAFLPNHIIHTPQP